MSMTVSSSEKSSQYANYPTPFNPSTTIKYDLSEPSWIELEMFNATGEKVATLVSERQSAGSHTVTWNGASSNGTPVASGVYICRLRSRSNGKVQSASMRLVLIK